jgi:hypothetical protein
VAMVTSHSGQTLQRSAPARSIPRAHVREERIGVTVKRYATRPYRRPFALQSSGKGQFPRRVVLPPRTREGEEGKGVTMVASDRGGMLQTLHGFRAYFTPRAFPVYGPRARLITTS